MNSIKLTCAHCSNFRYRNHQHFEHYFSAQTNQLIVLRLKPKRFVPFRVPIVLLCVIRRRFLWTFQTSRACNTSRSFIVMNFTQPRLKHPFIRKFVRLSSFSPYMTNTRRTLPPTSPSFVRNRFPFLAHVGVLVQTFRGVTPSFRLSNNQFPCLCSKRSAF